MDCFPMPCHYQSICMALLDFRLQCLFTSIPQSFWRIRHVTFVCQLDPHNNNIMYPNTCSGLTIAQQQLFITGSPNLILLSRSSNSSRLKRAKDLLRGWHQWFSAAISDAIFWYQQETIPKIIKYIYISNMTQIRSLRNFSDMFGSDIWRYEKRVQHFPRRFLRRPVSGLWSGRVLRFASSPCGGSLVNLIERSRRPMGIPTLATSGDIWPHGA